MLYNKNYVRIIILGLLILLLSEGIVGNYIFSKANNGLIDIQRATTLFFVFSIIFILPGIILTLIFIINTVRNDRFIHKKAVKEQETYLLNEEALYHKINEIIELCNNYAIVHSVLVIDIIFKGGNKALYDVVDHLEQTIRKNDLLFRMDNGNFVVIAYCNLQDAIGLGNKIINKMEDLGKEINSSIDTSIGITSTKDHDTKSHILDRTHKSVFAAIKYGRNRVEYMS